MILGFSTYLQGKPTNFVEKIWKGLKENLSKELYRKILSINTYEVITKQYPVDIEVYQKVLSKIHSIRVDKKNRWKEGTNIDFFINVRKKDMFRFAPVLPVVSIQSFAIYYEKDTFTEFIRPVVWIDEMMFYDPAKRCDFGMLKFAQNDGFETIQDFFNYFDKDFNGKIIHWTDLKY